MFTGVIVENSLTDTGILKDFNILKTWSDGDWVLHKVQADVDQIEQLAHSLSKGPWYVHFWESDKEHMLVVYKDKISPPKYSDKKLGSRLYSMV